jgi:hypothetical protein
MLTQKLPEEVTTCLLIRCKGGKYICAHLLRKGVKGSTVDSQLVVLSNRIFTIGRLIFVLLSPPSSLVGVEISKKLFCLQNEFIKNHPQEILISSIHSSRFLKVHGFFFFGIPSSGET